MPRRMQRQRPCSYTRLPCRRCRCMRVEACSYARLPCRGDAAAACASGLLVCHSLSTCLRSLLYSHSLSRTHALTHTHTHIRYTQKQRLLLMLGSVALTLVRTERPWQWARVYLLLARLHLQLARRLVALSQADAGRRCKLQVHTLQDTHASSTSCSTLN